MTEKNTYWLRDSEGTSALVTGADERDRWLPLGWAEADEPTDGFVHVWREGIAEPGLAAVAYHREVLSHAGWVVGPPPGGERPAEATTTAAEVPDTSAKPDDAAGKPKPSKSAAGGVEKE